MRIHLIAVAVVLAMAAPALAQEPQQRQIAVTGSATLTAANDTAGFTTGVDVRRSSPGAALRAASSGMRRVIAAVKARGIESKDIRTQHVGVRREVRRARPSGRRVITYVGTNTIRVTVRAIGNTGSVIDAAVKAGANRVGGLSFWRLRTGDLYRRALVQALRKARAKAEALAAESGTTLGGVLSISESGAQVEQYSADRAPAALTTSAAPVEPGRTRVRADLTVVFAIS